MLVLRAAVLVLLSGCGIVNTNAPKPVEPGGSSQGIAVARSGLQLGYVWHSATGTLDPIVGVTGAAHYGGAAFAPDPTILTAAAVSRDSSWGLVLHKDGTLDEWSSPASNVAALAAHIAPDAAIVFSPSGTCAAVASASALNAVVVCGLPSKPEIAMVALPAGFSRGQIAVSDGGVILAGLARTGSAGVEIGVLSDASAFAAMGTVQAWGGAGFSPGATSNSAAIADGATGQLYFAANVSAATPGLVPLATAGILAKPVAVSVSTDGKWAYVADSAKPQIVRVSTGAGGVQPVSIACACTPQQMAPLTIDGVYWLTKDAPGQPAWLLDTRTSQPRTFFVPALPGMAENQGTVSKVNQTGGSVR